MREYLDTNVRFKHRNDRSTVAIVEWSGLIGVGHSKLQPGDHYNQEIGEQIALGRALMDLGLKEQNRWVLRSRTEEEVQTQRANKRSDIEDLYSRMKELTTSANRPIKKKVKQSR